MIRTSGAVPISHHIHGTISWPEVPILRWSVPAKQLQSYWQIQNSGEAMQAGSGMHCKQESGMQNTYACLVQMAKDEDQLCDSRRRVPRQLPRSVGTAR